MHGEAQRFALQNRLIHNYSLSSTPDARTADALANDHIAQPCRGSNAGYAARRTPGVGCGAMLGAPRRSVPPPNPSAVTCIWPLRARNVLSLQATPLGFE